MKPIAPKRKGIRPLIVAVPTLGLLLWVYSALQFPRPEVSFLPKNVRMSQGEYIFYEDSLLSPISELSTWEWPFSQSEPLSRKTKKYVEEMKGLGFSNADYSYLEDSFQLYHPNGDAIYMVLNLDVYDGNGKAGNKMQYVRKESRPLYCLVKRLKAMYDEKVSPKKAVP